MRAKLRHECERCGLIAEFERAGRFRDEDFYEVFHELMEAQARIRFYAKWVHSLTNDIHSLQNGIGWRDAELALRMAELRAVGIEPLGTNPREEKAEVAG